MAGVAARSPGRVCLLGDNTDLIEKPALAAAISAYLTVELIPEEGHQATLSAEDIQYTEQFDLDDPVDISSPLKYLRAVAVRLRGHLRSGFSARIRSDIPIAAGLSSSTALCIAFIEALNKAYEIGLGTAEKAELAYLVENEDLGIECGRMDQYAIAFGGVTYIETGPEPQVEKLATQELPIIVADSEEKHNTQELQVWLRRRIQSGERELLDSLERVVELVEEGKKAISAGDLPYLGELMNRQQREEKLMGTSTDRLELLCRTAVESGAFGAKQMGAGGGGCMIALCPAGRQEAIKEALEGQGAPAWAFQIVSGR